MDNHNDNGKQMHSMMWMMVICCAVPLLILLFAGSAVFASGYLRYVIFGAVAIAGVWMMLRRHGSHGGDHKDLNEEKNSSSEDVKSSAHDMKKDHSCCH